MPTIPTTQYQLVQQSRKVVMEFCNSFVSDDYTKRVEYFGRGGSIRNLQVHIANTYVFWLINFGLKRSEPYFNLEEIHHPSLMEKCFNMVDRYVEEFINANQDQWDILISGTVPRSTKHLETTALTLFTHTVTHEYHHKGQILTMGRILGYTPPDADIIR